jgi:putative peptide zinc metalloprotease protein
MFAMAVYTLVGMPLFKLYTYLVGPRVHRNRPRAVLVSVLLATVLFGLIFLLPLPSAITANGVLEAEQTTPLFCGADGRLAELVVESGVSLRKGDVIARLHNPDLEHDLEVTRQQLAEIEMLYRQALRNSLSELGPLREREKTLRARLFELGILHRELVVTSPRAGRWVAPNLHELRETWIRRGENLGEIVAEQGYRLTAVVTQEDARALFDAHQNGVELRLTGQAEHVIAVHDIALIPYQRQELVSPALGWLGGGEFATHHEDQSGKRTTETFFELRAAIPAEALAGLTALHGLTGKVRIPLADRSLFSRLKESLLQLMQKRYKL